MGLRLLPRHHSTVSRINLFSPASATQFRDTFYLEVDVGDVGAVAFSLGDKTTTPNSNSELITLGTMQFEKMWEDNDMTSTIEAMRHQEECYCASDYLIDEALPQHQHANAKENDPIDGECRSRMVQWCYQIVDFCKFNRDTVAIAMNYLDRYMSTEQGAEALGSRTRFQLVVMTCLYTAIKIHEPEALAPCVLAGLSRNKFSVQEVEDMERELINALQWRMNPPTALSFMQALLSLIPKRTMEESRRRKVVELAQLQIEKSVEDYSFVGLKSSTIALAAIVNALKTIDLKVAYHFQIHLSKIAKIDSKSQLFVAVRKKMFTTIQSSELTQRWQSTQDPVTTITKARISSTQDNSRSPRSVVVSH